MQPQFWPQCNISSLSPSKIWRCPSNKNPQKYWSWGRNHCQLWLWIGRSSTLVPRPLCQTCLDYVCPFKRGCINPKKKNSTWFFLVILTWTSRIFLCVKNMANGNKIMKNVNLFLKFHSYSQKSQISSTKYENYPFLIWFFNKRFF